MPGIILQHDLLLNLGEEGGRRKEGREGKKNKKERGEEKEGKKGGRVMRVRRCYCTQDIYKNMYSMLCK